MNYSQLVRTIHSASRDLLGRAAVVVNQALVIRNWLIGAYVVEFQQQGQDRAKYGARLLERLARDLAARRLRGLDVRTLRDCRLLFQVYPQIRGTLSPESRTSSAGGALNSAAPSAAALSRLPALAKNIRGTASPECSRTISAELVACFSWSKLQELVRIEDPLKRAFYENECLEGNWSVRQLQRQIGSLLYERTGLSKNKKALVARARRQEPQQTIEDLIRDPYVLEFAGLAERPEYHESELEKALLDHLQHFLLELGTGFCFEARQKRITIGNEHDHLDLVFYQRRLRCHVLLDLKVRPFQHSDAGQMNFYLNWWKENGIEPGDNPPVGILLCSERDQTKVEFATAGMDNKLFVSRYLVNLPSVEQLRLSVETDRARVETILRLNALPLRKKGKAARQKRAASMHQQTRPVSRSPCTPLHARLARGHTRIRHCA